MENLSLGRLTLALYQEVSLFLERVANKYRIIMEEDKQQETTTSTVAGRPGIRPVTGLRFSSLVYMHCLLTGGPIVKRARPTRDQVNLS